MGYSIEGDLLEVCSCNVLCPCWIGEDPDGGQCRGTIAYRINKGEVDGVDMAGVKIASTLLIPDNVLAGNWTRQLYVDASANNEQSDAAIDLLQGRKGGPLGDLAGLVSKELEARRAEITFELDNGRGRLKVDGVLEAEMERRLDAVARRGDGGREEFCVGTPDQHTTRRGSFQLERRDRVFERRDSVSDIHLN